MAISAVNRVRIIADLLKDGNVENETPYGQLDLADANALAKYIQSYWTAFGPDVNAQNVPIQNPTNAQLSDFFLRRLSLQIKEVHVRATRNASTATADASAKAAANAEVLTDFGV